MKIIEWMLCVLVVAAVVYVLGGFISMDWNPASWEAPSRFILAAAALIFGSVMFTIRNEDAPFH